MGWVGCFMSRPLRARCRCTSYPGRCPGLVCRAPSGLGRVAINLEGEYVSRKDAKTQRRKVFQCDISVARLTCRGTGSSLARFDSSLRSWRLCVRNCRFQDNGWSGGLDHRCGRLRSESKAKAEALDSRRWPLAGTMIKVGAVYSGSWAGDLAGLPAPQGASQSDVVSGTT